jgi:hypothetical protein
MKFKVLIEFEVDAFVKQGTIDPNQVESIILDNVDILQLCENDDVFIKPNEDSFQVSIDEVTNATT